MALGYDQHLFLLAFDHRRPHLAQLFGVAGDPTPEEAARIGAAKAVVFAGFARALEEGAPAREAGILVDEQFGAEVARTALANGWICAMPVERSGTSSFDFEYGGDFAGHIEDFDPTFAKILVRYNVDGSKADNARSIEGLKKLSDWLQEHDRKLLCELIVPAEPAQLESVGGDEARYDTELRPALMRQAISDFQDAGIEADIWKIEGIDRRDDCEMIAEQARGRGARRRRLRRSRPRREHREGRALAPHRRRRARLPRVRDRPDDLVGPAQGLPRRLAVARRRREPDLGQLPPGDRGLHRRRVSTPARYASRTSRVSWVRRSAASSWRRWPAADEGGLDVHPGGGPADRGAEEPSSHGAHHDHVRAFDQLLDPGRGLPDGDRHRGRPAVRARCPHRHRGQPAAGLELAQLRRPRALAPHHHQVQPGRRFGAPRLASVSAAFGFRARVPAAFAATRLVARAASFLVPAITSLLTRSSCRGKGRGSPRHVRRNEIEPSSGVGQPTSGGPPEGTPRPHVRQSPSGGTRRAAGRHPTPARPAIALRRSSARTVAIPSESSG